MSIKCVYANFFSQSQPIDKQTDRMQDSDSGEHIFTICLCPPSCFLFCFVYHFIPVVSFSRSDFLDQHEEPTSRNVPVTLSQNPPMDVDAESERSAGDHIRTGGRSFFYRTSILVILIFFHLQ